MLYAGYFILGFLLTMSVTPWVSRMAYKIGALDKPNKRKVHNRIMPRLGGLAVFAGFIVPTIFMPHMEQKILGILIGGIIILLTGIIDDVKGISPRGKLFCQFIAACAVVAFGVRIEFVNNPFDGYLYFGVLSFPVTVFWIISVTNAVNLIDGLDGLASGVSFIALLTFAFVANSMGNMTLLLLVLPLAGAVLGFLRYNFYPARIFLGDSGSMFLGFMISCLAVYGFLKGVAVVTFIIPVIILGVPIFDTCFAILRRYFEHKPILQADMKHLHHRLLSRGLSHPQAVLVIYCISIFFSMSAIIFLRNWKLF